MASPFAQPITEQQNCCTTILLALAARPLHHRSQFYVIAKHLVRGDPALQILQRRRMHEFDGLPRAGFTAQIRHHMREHFRNQAKFGWDGDFDHAGIFRDHFDAMLSPKMQVCIGSPKGFPSFLSQIQESKFASESNRWFGLVFREAGPVVPSTFEVVATKVA